MFEEINRFWFHEIDSKMWWVADTDFDTLIQKRFQNLHTQAASAELSHWRESFHGRLAEIIVLDQFSRNIYRNTALAFKQDAMALCLSQEAISLGALESLNEAERSFLLLPYMHSESQVIHSQAEQLYKEYSNPNSYEFELKHKAIIDRFGRYPHRNIILGRNSTEEEIDFLKEPGSSF